MYEFNKLASIYKVSVDYGLPDGSQTVYRSHVRIKAKRERKTDFLFTVLNRQDVTINNHTPTQTMDLLMLKLGDALYPLELSAGENGRLIDIENFEQIRKRWHEISALLLKENFTLPFEKYIHISRQNMNDLSSFRKAISRDSFIKYYFLPLGAEYIELECENFPVKGKTLSCMAVKDRRQSMAYYFVPLYDGDYSIYGQLKYQRGEYGELIHIDVDYNMVTADGECYHRGIVISTNMGDHHVSCSIF